MCDIFLVLGVIAPFLPGVILPRLGRAISKQALDVSIFYVIAFNGFFLVVFFSIPLQVLIKLVRIMVTTVSVAKFNTDKLISELTTGTLTLSPENGRRQLDLARRQQIDLLGTAFRIKGLLRVLQYGGSSLLIFLLAAVAEAVCLTEIPFLKENLYVFFTLLIIGVLGCMTLLLGFVSLGYLLFQ